MRQMLAAVVLLAWGASAQAAGCDLDQVIGYQLALSRTIEGYIDPGQKQQFGFEGCEPGRVLVFTDRTGVRCKVSGRQNLNLPEAWLFVRSRDDMKLCVGDDVYPVGPMR